MNITLTPAETAQAGWSVAVSTGAWLRMWHGRTVLDAHMPAHTLLSGLGDYRPARLAWAIADGKPPAPIVGERGPNGCAWSIGVEHGRPTLRVVKGKATIAAHLTGRELIALHRFAEGLRAYANCATDEVPAAVCSGPLVVAA